MAAWHSRSQQETRLQGVGVWGSLRQSIGNHHIEAIGPQLARWEGKKSLINRAGLTPTSAGKGNKRRQFN
jgi:hypothetical protein